MSTLKGSNFFLDGSDKNKTRFPSIYKGVLPLLAVHSYIFNTSKLEGLRIADEVAIKSFLTLLEGVSGNPKGASDITARTLGVEDFKNNVYVSLTSVIPLIAKIRSSNNPYLFAALFTAIMQVSPLEPLKKLAILIYLINLVEDGVSNFFNNEEQVLEEFEAELKAAGINLDFNREKSFLASAVKVLNERSGVGSGTLERVVSTIIYDETFKGMSVEDKLSLDESKALVLINAYKELESSDIINKLSPTQIADLFNIFENIRSDAKINFKVMADMIVKHNTKAFLGAGVFGIIHPKLVYSFLNSLDDVDVKKSIMKVLIKMVAAIEWGVDRPIAKHCIRTIGKSQEFTDVFAMMTIEELAGRIYEPETLKGISWKDYIIL